MHSSSSSGSRKQHILDGEDDIRGGQHSIAILAVAHEDAAARLKEGDVLLHGAVHVHPQEEVEARGTHARRLPQHRRVVAERAREALCEDGLQVVHVPPV